MRFKDKLLVQVVLCLTIFAAVRGFSMFSSKGTSEFQSIIKEHIKKNYSSEEIIETSSQLLTEIKAVSGELISKIDDNLRNEEG
jgi:hypothetical protein